MKKTLYFIAIMFLLSCKNKTNEVFLKVGNHIVSRYEYEKNENIFKTTSQNSINNDSDENLNEWKKRFIEKSYIIADAYEKRYDTILTIRNQIKYMGDYMMCKRYGYLWNKIFSPTVDRAKLLNKDKLEKRKNLFYFEFISTSNHDVLEDLKNIQNKEEFQIYKQNHSNNPLVNIGYFSMQWPFFPLWDYKDKIMLLKPHDVSEIILADNFYYILYVDHVEEIPLSESDKEKASTELQLGTEEDLIKELYSEIYKKSDFSIHEREITLLENFMNHSKQISDFPSNPVIAQYKIDEQLHEARLNQIIEYHQNQPVLNPINDIGAFKEIVNNYFIDEYLKNEATKLNLYNDPLFLLDKKNFTNNLIYNYYIENEIQLDISFNEIETFYSNNLNQFQQPENISVDIVLFENINDALLYKEKLFNIKADENIVIQRDVRIEMEQINDYNLKRNLIDLELNNFTTEPLAFAGKYAYFFKKSISSDTINIDLSEVEDLLRKYLENEKMKEAIKEHSLKLMSKYKMYRNKII